MMKAKLTLLALIVFVISTSGVYGDTFKNKSSDEVFHGFKTQKSSRTKDGVKTLVYNSEEKALKAINLADYTVTYDTNGRRDSAIIVPINASEVLLSQVVSENIAKAITEASNTGPQIIILEIDNPGGRGEYMKIIADAVLDTTRNNICPVVAYISGGQYGGAFSSAAVIALACDRIFIAPTASIGAVGPMVGAGMTDDAFGAYLKTYSPDTLATYSMYVNAMAQHNDRPSLLVQALVNKHTTVLEVSNINGSRQFVQEREGTQTLVRTVCSGLGDQNDSTGGQSAVISPASIVGAVLQLTPTDAVNVGLVDKMADSIKEILVAQNLPDVQLVNAPGIDKTLKKYIVARRNISELLSHIQYLEDYASKLNDQLGEVERMLRTGTQTREVTEGSPYSSSLYRRDTVRLPREYEGYYYDPDKENRYYATRRSDYSGYGQYGGYQSITVEEPTNVYAIYNESASLLRDLISEYQRAINLGKRWPGGLPPELPVQSLENNMNTAQKQLEYILRMQVQYQQQLQYNQTNRNMNNRTNRTNRSRY